MTEGTDALDEKALELSANVPDNFLELGRALSRLYDRDPNLFRQLAAKSNMGLRKGDSPGDGGEAASGPTRSGGLR